MTEAVAMVRGGRARAWATRISLASVAPVADFAGRFIRTIILSRLLVPAEFGTSVALTVVLGAATMVSDIGLDRFVLLKSESDNRAALAAAHAIQLIRGVLIALCVASLAQPAATFFAVPNASGSFLLAALIPLIHSFTHLGPKQAQREYDFRSDAASTFAASAASVLVALPAVWLTQSHNAILVCLITSELVYVIATHLLSAKRYEIEWQGRIVREALRYGLPLTINGFGLAMFSQADRALVGAFFGVKTLAAYGVITSLAIVSISPFYAIGSSLSVSILARNHADEQRFPDLLMAIVWSFGTFALLYSTAIGLTLDLVVPRVFGDQYRVSYGVQITLAMIAFIRIARGPSSAVLLVDGETSRLTVANLVGGTGLAIAALFVYAVPRLESVLLGLLAGDLLSFVLLQCLLFRRASDLRQRLFDAVAFGSLAAGGLCLALLAVANHGYGGRVTIAFACFVIALWMGSQVLAAVTRSSLVHLQAYRAPPCVR